MAPIEREHNILVRARAGNLGNPCVHHMTYIMYDVPALQSLISDL